MLHSVLCSLRRHIGRTALSMFGTVIGTMAVIIICVISSAGIAEFEEELNSLGLNGLLLTADNGNCEVELDDIEYINALNFVDRTMPIVSGDAVISTERDSSEVYLWGVDNNADKIISLNVSRGRLIEMGDISSASDVCIIDDVLAQKLCGTKNALGQTVEIGFGDTSGIYTVIGVLSTEGSLLRGVAGSYMPSFIYVPYTSLQQQLGDPSLTMIAVTLCSGCDNDRAAAEIEQLMQGIGGNLSAYKSDNLSNQRDTLLGLLDIMTAIILCIGLVSVLVSAIGLMNVMLMSVNERTGEIGIKKALGAGCGTIALEFMLEAIIICLTASLIGVSLGVAVSYAASVAAGFTFSINWATVLAIVAATVSMGALFGIYPALKAGRLSPIDALRKI